MNEISKNRFKALLLILGILIWDRYMPLTIAGMTYVPVKHFAYNMGWVDGQYQFILGFGIVCFTLVESIPLWIILILKKRDKISKSLYKWSIGIISLIFLNTIFCAICMKYAEFEPWTIWFFSKF